MDPCEASVEGDPDPDAIATPSGNASDGTSLRSRKAYLALLATLLLLVTCDQRSPLS